MTSRREFLSVASLAATGLVLSPLAGCGVEAPPAGTAATPAPPPPLTGPMITRAIPSTGEMLPVIGAGTSGSYEVAMGSPEYQALEEVVRIFFEGGGSVIDTAPMYSNAEEVVGSLLESGGWRDRCFLATKLVAREDTSFQQQWEESLRRLRTDHVELLAVHNMNNMAEALPFARELKEQGLVKYVGITHGQTSAQAQMLQAMQDEKPDFIQINYSVNAPAAASRLFPTAQDLGIAVMVNRAFDDGRLFGRVGGRALPGWAAELGITSWSQMFLKFVISQPAVTVVIPATGKPERQADQLRAGHGELLSRAQQDELVGMFA